MGTSCVCASIVAGGMGTEDFLAMIEENGLTLYLNNKRN